MTSQVMTTEQLRTQHKPENVEANFNTYRGFQAMHHMAESLANSTIIPEAFRNTLMVKDRYDQNAKKWLYRTEENPNGVSNCIIALNMAQRLGADPMMIMQNLYLVDGRPSWSSQFIIAAINSCGRYSPLRFDITGGDEEMEIPYAVTEWEYNKETRKRELVESNKVARVKNLKCVAWVIEKATGERLESSPITMELAVKKGWFQKNGSKWQTMPEQMLRYRAASLFGRIYAPDLLMGLRTHEEELDSIIDITPEPEVTAQPVTLDSIKQNVVKESPAAEQEAPAEKPKRTRQPKAVDAETVETIEDSQNQTSNDVAKKPSSLELRKEYLEQIYGFTHAKDLQTIIPIIEGHPDLTDAHKTYLVNAIHQKIEELGKAQIDPIKSKSIMGGLKTSIENAKTTDELKNVAALMTQNKPKLTLDHQGELLEVYRMRKELIENQQDMFAQNKPWIEGAIQRIEAAKTQDDINEVYTDPAYEELSDQGKQRLDLAAQQREAELFG